MDIIFILFSIPLLTLCAISFWIAGYFRARRKGYKPPTATLVLMSGVAAGLLSVVVIAPRVVLSPHSAVAVFSTFFWLPLVVSVIVTTSIILILPRRNPRMPGPRRPRFPFFATGILLVGIGVVFLLFAIVKGEGASSQRAVEILIMLAAFAAPLFFMGRRGAVSLDEATRKDPRSCVLYLRPFIQEGDVFVSGPNSRFGSFTSSWQRSLSGLGELSFGGQNTLNPDPQVTVRFEQYFFNAFTQRIGPFVALGNPEDYTQPEGAVRMYASDVDWKSHVERLAGASSCIVTEVAGSNNLKWELDYLRQQELHQKLFVFTKPAKAIPYKLYPFFIWLKGGVPAVKWADYAESMASSGYQLGDDPGPGAVMAFDAMGQAVTLTTGAHSPEDFVEPIRSLLESRDGYASEALDPPVIELPSAPPFDEKPSETEASASKASSKWTSIKASNWWLPMWFIVLVAAYSIGVPVARQLIADRQDSARAAALKELAPQIGLTLLQGDESFGDADLLASTPFSEIKNRGFSNVMQGKVNGLHAILFDDQNEWQTDDDDGSKTTHKSAQTVAAFSHPGRRLPRFEVRENTFGNFMNATDVTSRIVDLQEYPDFSKRFVVTSDEIEETRRLFSAPFREFLLNAYPPGYKIEGSGSWLVFYKPNTRLEPKQWRSFLQESSKVADGVFQNSGSPN